MRSILWTSLYWAWFASEVVIAVATRIGKSGGKVRDHGSQLILWIVILIAVQLASGADAHYRQICLAAQLG